MAQRAPVELARQQFQELAEIGLVEFLGRRELPEHRAEPVAELQHAGIVELLDGIAGLRQHPAVGGKARALDREHETIRHLARPFAKALRLLRAVIGAVDLDRGQFRCRVLPAPSPASASPDKTPRAMAQRSSRRRRYRCGRLFSRRSGALVTASVLLFLHGARESEDYRWPSSSGERRESSPSLTQLAVALGLAEKENTMRTIGSWRIALASVAWARWPDDLEEAHRQAPQGRDATGIASQGNIRAAIKTMSARISPPTSRATCASERQNFRVSRFGYHRRCSSPERSVWHRQPARSTRAKGHHQRVRPAQGRALAAEKCARRSGASVEACL